MSDGKSTPPPRSVDLEERGSVVSDVIVPLAQAGVGGAVGALVSNHLSKPKGPPAPPPPSAEE
jgi:hypothetical protein